MTPAQAKELKTLADQWANHAALAAVCNRPAKRYKIQRREEMKSRFLARLAELTDAQG